MNMTQYEFDQTMLNSTQEGTTAEKIKDVSILTMQQDKSILETKRANEVFAQYERKAILR